MIVCEDMVPTSCKKYFKYPMATVGGREGHFQRQNQPTVNTFLRTGDLPIFRLLD